MQRARQGTTREVDAAQRWNLSAGLIAALDGHARRAIHHLDPAATVRTTSDFLAAMTAELERFAAIRLTAIANLRAHGLSYDRIAATTGLSKARVAQLATTHARQVAAEQERDTL